MTASDSEGCMENGFGAGGASGALSESGRPTVLTIRALPHGAPYSYGVGLLSTDSRLR